jgi:hypothetical protein
MSMDDLAERQLLKEKLTVELRMKDLGKIK